MPLAVPNKIPPPLQPPIDDVVIFNALREAITKKSMINAALF
jgi:hypothetical protein